MFLDFGKVWKNSGAQNDALIVFHDLNTRYAEPHRHYHNLKHICAVFAEFSAARQLCPHPNEVELAIWFHDAIYDPKAKDNEEQSANLCADAVLRGGAPGEIVDRTVALILATKHTALPSGVDAAVLVDADLSILGQPPSDFDAYEINIRKEYAWVDDDAFRKGRAAVLQSFLDRPRIFTTEHFAQLYESRLAKI